MPADISEQYDKIYRYCYFKTCNADTAEDLTQETFLRFFAQSSYLERGKQMAYLYTIARNLCMDTFRQRKTEELDEETPGKNPLEQAERTFVIRQALAALPEEERELLLLRYANGLSVGELAAFKGLSRYAVYRRMNAALAAMKKLLREEDFI